MQDLKNRTSVKQRLAELKAYGWSIADYEWLEDVLSPLEDVPYIYIPEAVLSYNGRALPALIRLEWDLPGWEVCATWHPHRRKVIELHAFPDDEKVEYAIWDAFGVDLRSNDYSRDATSTQDIATFLHDVKTFNIKPNYEEQAEVDDRDSGDCPITEEEYELELLSYIETLRVLIQQLMPPHACMLPSGLVQMPPDLQAKLGLSQDGGVLFVERKDTGHIELLTDAQFCALLPSNGTQASQKRSASSNGEAT